MFRDMGNVSPEEAELLRKASEPWLFELLTSGEYFGWLVEHEGTAVSGGRIFVRTLGPVPGCYRVGPWGHIANIYTEPAHRRRGLARRLMEFSPAASEEGRALYESFGFKPASEMKLSK